MFEGRRGGYNYNEHLQKKIYRRVPRHLHTDTSGSLASFSAPKQTRQEAASVSDSVFGTAINSVSANSHLLFRKAAARATFVTMMSRTSISNLPSLSLSPVRKGKPWGRLRSTNHGCSWLSSEGRRPLTSASSRRQPGATRTRPLATWRIAEIRATENAHPKFWRSQWSAEHSWPNRPTATHTRIERPPTNTRVLKRSKPLT